VNEAERIDIDAGRFSARVFSLMFGLGYAAAVYINYPLFRYYPLIKQFSLRDLPGTAQGPAMTYYGWISIALIPAVVVSAIVPKRWGNRLPSAIFWVLPFVMLLSAYYREQSWFH
jgi:hypothetical protein